jgi:hypothetical protein
MIEWFKYHQQPQSCGYREIGFGALLLTGYMAGEQTLRP